MATVVSHNLELFITDSTIKITLVDSFCLVISELCNI